METICLAPCKKNAARLAAHLVFIDESGFLLIPSVHKTWSPVGQTPIVLHRYCHDRISAISGIAVSPKRFHCTLYCQLYEDNIHGEEVAAFLRQLLRQDTRPSDCPAGQWQDSSRRSRTGASCPHVSFASGALSALCPRIEPR